MRALAGCGVLTQHADGSFSGAVHRAPDPWADWGNLEHSVRTGKTAFTELHGRPFFEYLEADPEFAAVFNNAMTASSGLADDVALDARLHRIQARRRCGRRPRFGTDHDPAQRPAGAGGVLYDLPDVDLPDVVARRASVAGGSFIDSVPAGGRICDEEHYP